MGRTRNRRNSLSIGLNTINPKETDSAMTTSPVVSRMARPRRPILHLPGTYSELKSYQFLRVVTSFICPLWYIDDENWLALPLSHLRKTISRQPRLRKP